MASNTAVDNDLTQLEADIRRLRAEYEQYYAGGRRRIPAETQWLVDDKIEKVTARMAQYNVSQRFRLTNITQTYVKYVEVWKKRTQRKESGEQRRHFGAAARAVVEQRLASPAQVPASEPAPPAAPLASFSISVGDPDREGEKVQALYKQLVVLGQEVGDHAGPPSFAAFERLVRQRTDELKKNGVREIEYSVSLDNGRVKLKARVAS
ncbi:MAG: MXAN_5187 C-terminal domain-containing protein [Candidatus Acidiferrales bacterium]